MIYLELAVVGRTKNGLGQKKLETKEQIPHRQIHKSKIQHNPAIKKKKKFKTRHTRRYVILLYV